MKLQQLFLFLLDTTSRASCSSVDNNRIRELTSDERQLLRRYQVFSDTDARDVTSLSQPLLSGDAPVVTSHVDEPDYDEIDDWDEIGE